MRSVIRDWAESVGPQQVAVPGPQALPAQISRTVRRSLSRCRASTGTRRRRRRRGADDVVLGDLAELAVETPRLTVVADTDHAEPRVRSQAERDLLKALRMAR